MLLTGIFNLLSINSAVKSTSGPEANKQKAEKKGPREALEAETLYVNNSDSTVYQTMRQAILAADSGDVIHIVNLGPTDHHNDDRDSSLHAGDTLPAFVGVSADPHWRGSEAPYTYYIENWGGTSSYGTSLALNDHCQVGPFQVRNGLVNVDANGKQDINIFSTIIRWAKFDSVGSGGVGLDLRNSSSLTLNDDKIFENPGQGIIATGARGLTIINSTFATNGGGDSLFPFTVGAGFALDGFGGPLSLLRADWFHDNGYGAVRADAGGGAYSSVIANCFFQNEHYAVVADEHSYVNIFNNTFTACSIAVSIWNDSEPNLGWFAQRVMGRNYFDGNTNALILQNGCMRAHFQGNCFNFAEVTIDEESMWVTDPLASTEDNLTVGAYVESLRADYLPLIRSKVRDNAHPGADPDSIADFMPFMLPPLGERTGGLPYYFWYGYEVPLLDISRGTTRIVVRDLAYDDAEEPYVAFLGTEGGVERIIQFSFHEADPEDRDCNIKLYLRPGGLHLVRTGSSPRDILYDPVANYGGGYQTNVNEMINIIEGLIAEGGWSVAEERALKVLDEYFHNIYGGGSPYTSIEEPVPDKPSQPAISAYPNPFNSALNIEYVLGQRANKVQLIFYNLAGQVVLTFNEGAKDAGRYKITAEAGKDGLPSGLYMVRLLTDGQRQNTNVILVK